MEQKDIKLILTILLKSMVEDENKLTTGDICNKNKTNKSITVNSWMDIYENIALGHLNYKEQTLRNRRAIFKHIRSLWGEYNITELRPFEITSKLKVVKETSPSTAQRILAELRQMYQEAIANNYSENNPALHVKNFRVKVQRKRLAWEVWKEMYVYAKNDCPQRWVHIMLLLALITGQRRADLARMKYSDVRNGYLHIEQQKQAGKGYGARIALPIGLKLNGIRLNLGDIILLSKKTAPKGVRASGNYPGADDPITVCV